MATKAQVEQKILDELYDAINEAGTASGDLVVFYTKAYEALHAQSAPAYTSFFLIDTASSDDYAADLDAYTEYTTGHSFFFVANTANVGAASLNINSLGAVAIKKNVNEDLANDDIKAGQISLLVYDGTNFQIISGAGGGGGIATKFDKRELNSTDITNGYYAFSVKAYGDAGEKNNVQLTVKGSPLQEYGEDYTAMNNDANDALVIIWKTTGTVDGITTPVYPATGLESDLVSGDKLFAVYDILAV
jgi:hypothetical protein